MIFLYRIAVSGSSAELQRSPRAIDDFNTQLLSNLEAYRANPPELGVESRDAHGPEGLRCQVHVQATFSTISNPDKDKAVSLDRCKNKGRKMCRGISRSRWMYVSLGKVKPITNFSRYNPPRAGNVLVVVVQ